MWLELILIAVVIYLCVIFRAQIRLPHPGMQAAVDLLTAAELKDEEVMRMAKGYIGYCDANNSLAPLGDPHADRLHRLTGRFVKVDGLPLALRVFQTDSSYAFAHAHGAGRRCSGLWDQSPPPHCL